MKRSPLCTVIFEYAEGVSTAESLTETRLLWLAQRKRAADHFARAVETVSRAPKSEPSLFSGAEPVGAPRTGGKR